MSSKINYQSTATLRVKAVTATTTFENLNQLELSFLQFKRDNVDTVILLNINNVLTILRSMLLKNS